MKASEIFHKTAKGLSEIETKSNTLSLKERRVLILVNGENNTATLKQLSLCENIAEILETLLEQGFIEHDGAAGPVSQGSASGESTETEIDISARNFMCNSLLTFANSDRVGKLIEEINAVDDIDSLKQMVNPWYHAISETPGGMHQADDLKKEVLSLIEDEEIGGIR